MRRMLTTDVCLNVETARTSPSDNDLPKARHDERFPRGGSTRKDGIANPHPQQPSSTVELEAQTQKRQSKKPSSYKAAGTFLTNSIQLLRKPYKRESAAIITGKRQASHMEYGSLPRLLSLSSCFTKGYSQQKKKREPVDGVSHRQTLSCV